MVMSKKSVSDPDWSIGGHRGVVEIVFPRFLSFSIH